MDGYRLRLEGRAALLEATRLRYRALVGILRTLRWKARLRKNAALLREVAARQAEVDAALAAATRRARAERWPPREPMTRCLAELAKLRAQLTRVASKRLGEAEEAPLGALLERLDAEVVVGTRALAAGQRLSAAIELLPPTLVELRRAAAFGERLEQLFGRPAAISARMPLSAAEAAELAARWAGGQADLAASWGRLAALDRSGTLVRFLQRRARRAPLHPPQNGAEQLLHAEFWHAVAQAKLRGLVAERFEPIEAGDGELLDLAGYACAREASEAARLATSAAMAEERAGLFELALERWHGSHAGQALFAASRWDLLFAKARRADEGGPSADAAKLRDALWMDIRMQGEPPRNDTFLSLVTHAQSLPPRAP